MKSLDLTLRTKGFTRPAFLVFSFPAERSGPRFITICPSNSWAGHINEQFTQPI